MAGADKGAGLFSSFKRGFTMPTDVFRRELDANAMLNLQSRQYQERIPMAGEVPANGQTVARINIASLGAFRSLWITGDFTTLALDGQAIVDDGICRLRGKLIDGSIGRDLHSDWIPLNLYLSPGRVRRRGIYWENAGGTIRAAASGSLFFPIEFDYTFDANADILFDVKSDSDTTNYFNLCFHGIRIKSAAAVSGLRR